MSENILIIGENGQIARNLKKQLGSRAISLNREILDLSKPESIESVLSKYSPKIIINAAAYTQVDKAESEEELANIINGVSPGIIAKYAKENNIIFIHYSTDYVFAGNQNRELKEGDITNPLSIYGKSKLLGEVNIKKIGGKYLIIRISGIYNEEGHNFVKTMLRLGLIREELKIVADQFTSPSYAHDIAKATIDLIDNINLDKTGQIYHLCNKGAASWFEFAKKIFELATKYNISHNIKNIFPITTAEYPLPATRPAYSILNSDKIRNDYGISLPHWQESLELAIKNISNN